MSGYPVFESELDDFRIPFGAFLMIVSAYRYKGD